MERAHIGWCATFVLTFALLLAPCLGGDGAPVIARQFMANITILVDDDDAHVVHATQYYDADALRTVVIRPDGTTTLMAWDLNRVFSYILSNESGVIERSKCASFWSSVGHYYSLFAWLQTNGFVQSLGVTTSSDGRICNAYTAPANENLWYWVCVDPDDESIPMENRMYQVDFGDDDDDDEEDNASTVHTLPSQGAPQIAAAFHTAARVQRLAGVEVKLLKQTTYTDVRARPFDPSLLSTPTNCLGDVSLPPDAPYGLFDGFESGSVGDFWIPCGTSHQRWVCGHITPQTTVVRSGKFSANITIEPGDISQDGENGSERDELDSREWAVLGEEIYYGWSFMLPTDFPIVDIRLVIAQWKAGAMGDRSPICASRFRNGLWYWTVYVNEKTTTFDDIGPLVLGEWHDMVMRIKYTQETDGVITVWKNGTQLFEYTGQTAWDIGNPVLYSKFGLYRDVAPDSWTMFFDSYTVGKSYEEVDPSRFD